MANMTRCTRSREDGLSWAADEKGVLKFFLRSLKSNWCSKVAQVPKEKNFDMRGESLGL